MTIRNTWDTIRDKDNTSDIRDDSSDACEEIGQSLQHDSSDAEDLDHEWEGYGSSYASTV